MRCHLRYRRWAWPLIALVAIFTFIALELGAGLPKGMGAPLWTEAGMPARTLVHRNGDRLSLSPGEGGWQWHLAPSYSHSWASWRPLRLWRPEPSNTRAALSPSIRRSTS